MSLKIIELFAGIGSPRKSLNNLNIDHEIVAFSEIDKYAEESYRAIHNDYITKNLGDITKIKELPACDLLVFGSPCQDISIAGKQQGIQEGTRSGLLLEVLRLLEVYKNKKTLPKYLLLENVSNILSKEHRKEFQNYLLFLEKLGYKNFYKVLNAVDYEIPQNRERLFCLSILDEKAKYNFPGPKKLKIFLRDLLEKEVDKKYYLDNEKTNKFIHENWEKIKEIEETGKVNFISSLSGKNSQGERVYYPDVAVTLAALGGGFGGKTGLYLTKIINDDISLCITSSYAKGTNLKGYLHKRRRQLVQEDNFKIRRLTPLECFRLMGFSDTDFINAQKTISDSQLYKQAGNSIVVNVLEAIFKNLFLEEETPVIQKLF